jgi:lysophospholipase L1-like esterase
MRRPLTLALGALLAGCLPTSTASPTQPSSPAASPAQGSAGALRFVALGDSYTIGTSVATSDRWPNQLVARLGATAPTLELVANPAVNGYTSRDVIDDELPQLHGLLPGFASLLIGVNDVVQGVSEATFRANVEHILDDLVARVGANRIIVLTTPDYTVTPAGADYGDPAVQSAGIQSNNAILTRAAQARGIAVVDIYDISLRTATDRSLVAVDGLHPSGAQYALWVDRIAPVVEALLGR